MISQKSFMQKLKAQWDEIKQRKKKLFLVIFHLVSIILKGGNLSLLKN